MVLLPVFAMALLVTLWFASDRSPLSMLDAPNERSLHTSATPHTGGLAILIAMMLGWAWIAMDAHWPATMSWIAAAAFLVAVVSLIDDIRPLSPLLRIVVHAIAATLLVGTGVTLPGLFGGVLSWLAIVWMLNLYNFMDGMDGFAGGMTLSGFLFLAMAGWMGGSESYALYSLVIAAAAAGFLCINFPPARIFMGDAGAATIGLLAAAFSLWGVRDGLFEWWFPLLVFSPFVVDASVTLLRRMLKRERIWEAHRSHYYQQLVQAGWGHRKTVLSEYALMLAAGGSAIVADSFHFSTAVWLLLACWTAIFAFLIRAIVNMAGETDA